jgi:hypothetical protein
VVEVETQMPEVILGDQGKTVFQARLIKYNSHFSFFCWFLYYLLDVDRVKILGVIEREGFTWTITEDNVGHIFFTADADIDADGANGQNGAPAAYKNDDTEDR